MSELVSIRMPSSLVKELKTLTAKNHFMDLSEQLRSIIRMKCVQYSTPYSYEIKRVVKDLEQAMKERKIVEDKQALMIQLNNILKELQDE